MVQPVTDITDPPTSSLKIIHGSKTKMNIRANSIAVLGESIDVHKSFHT